MHQPVAEDGCLCRRYRLHTPSPAYASTYTSAQQKVEMCAVTLQMMDRNGKVTAGAAAMQAAAELGLDEDHADIAFAEEQVSTWTEVGSLENHNVAMRQLESQERPSCTVLQTKARGYGRCACCYIPINVCTYAAGCCRTPMVVQMTLQADAPSEAAGLSEGAGKGRKRKAEAGAPSAKHAGDETTSVAENGDEGAADDLDLDDEDSQQDDGAIVRKKKKRRRRRKSGSGLVSTGPEDYCLALKPTSLHGINH